MFDIKVIRNDPDLFDASLSKRGEKPFSKEILKFDRERRKLIEELEKIKADRNSASNQFGSSKNHNSKVNLDELRQKISKQKTKISELEEKVRNVEQSLNSILLNLPNVLTDSVFLSFLKLKTCVPISSLFK